MLKEELFEQAKIMFLMEKSLMEVLLFLEKNNLSANEAEEMATKAYNEAMLLEEVSIQENIEKEEALAKINFGRAYVYILIGLFLFFVGGMLIYAKLFIKISLITLFTGIILIYKGINEALGE